MDNDIDLITKTTTEKEDTPEVDEEKEKEKAFKLMGISSEKCN